MSILLMQCTKRKSISIYIYIYVYLYQYATIWLIETPQITFEQACVVYKLYAISVFCYFSVNWWKWILLVHFGNKHIWAKWKKCNHCYWSPLGININSFIINPYKKEFTMHGFFHKGNELTMNRLLISFA